MPDMLPPYSGEDTTCVKCGNKGAFTEYRGYGKCLHDACGGTLGLEPNERLHRQCARCNYAWDEATVQEDADEAATMPCTCNPSGACTAPCDAKQPEGASS